MVTNWTKKVRDWIVMLDSPEVTTINFSSSLVRERDVSARSS